MDLDYASVHNHAKKELGQYPAILTAHLVNNPYICLQFYGSIVCFVWKPEHFEVQGYGGAIEFVEKNILIS